jgi:ribonuclease P protein component
MAQLTARPTFPKRERLTGALRIQDVATTGLAVSEPPFRLIGKTMALRSPVPLQVAFAVPKRHLPLAVDRNRMRRRMREAYRLLKAPIHERLRGDGVQCAWLFVFQGKECIAFDTTERKISRAMDRWLNEHLERGQ